MARRMELPRKGPDCGKYRTMEPEDIRRTFRLSNSKYQAILEDIRLDYPVQIVAKMHKVEPLCVEAIGCRHRVPTWYHSKDWKKRVVRYRSPIREDDPNDPTPEQIEQATQAIRDGWTEEDEANHRWYQRGEE